MTSRKAARHARVGVVRGQYKYVRWEARGSVREQIYRRPDEVSDVSASRPDLVQALRAAVDTRLRAKRPAGNTKLPEFSADDREALQALGYLGE